MSYTANDPRVFYDAITARLASATGLLVGEGEKPAGVVLTDDELPQLPYYIVFPLDDEDTTGSLSDPDSDVWWRWQVTAVGGRMDQTQVAQHKARAAFLGWNPVVAGLSLSKVELSLGTGVSRDDDVQPPLFYSTDRFRVFTSPT